MKSARTTLSCPMWAVRASCQHERAIEDRASRGERGAFAVSRFMAVASGPDIQNNRRRIFRPAACRIQGQSGVHQEDIPIGNQRTFAISVVRVNT